MCILGFTKFPLFMFFSPFLDVGGRGWLPRGLGHNLLMHFSNLGTSEMEISETDVFDSLTIQNGRISYVNHVSAPLYVFFKISSAHLPAHLPLYIGQRMLREECPLYVFSTLFGFFSGGEGSQGG